jgi:hypothetical protein
MLHFGAWRLLGRSVVTRFRSADAPARFLSRVRKNLCYSDAAMQTDDETKKAAPVRAAKKSEGWREREESRNAGVAPRTTKDNGGVVRC